MTIQEAIRAMDQNYPYITREKWFAPRLEPGPLDHMLRVTNAPRMAIRVCKRCGTKWDALYVWEPRMEDLLADDWKAYVPLTDNPTTPQKVVVDATNGKDPAKVAALNISD